MRPSPALYPVVQNHDRVNPSQYHGPVLQKPFPMTVCQTIVVAVVMEFVRRLGQWFVVVIAAVVGVEYHIGSVEIVAVAAAVVVYDYFFLLFWKPALL